MMVCASIGMVMLFAHVLGLAGSVVVSGCIIYSTHVATVYVISVPFLLMVVRPASVAISGGNGDCAMISRMPALGAVPSWFVVDSLFCSIHWWNLARCVVSVGLGQYSDHSGTTWGFQLLLLAGSRSFVCDHHS